MILVPFRQGVVTTRQVCPSQWAASVESVTLREAPTAQTSLVETADTDTKSGIPAAASGGAACHVVPLKCSNRPCARLLPSKVKPAAHRSRAEVPPTAFSSSSAPGPVKGFGLGTTAQDLPVKCSIRVRVPPAVSEREPAAHTLAGATSSTPLSTPLAAALGSGGVAVIRQA